MARAQAELLEAFPDAIASTDELDDSVQNSTNIALRNQRMISAYHLALVICLISKHDRPSPHYTSQVPGVLSMSRCSAGRRKGHSADPRPPNACRHGPGSLLLYKMLT